MNFNDPHDPYNPARSNIFRHAGFRFGFVGGVFMIGVHLFLLLIFTGGNEGDLLAWLLQLFVYFMIGRAGAQGDYNDNARNNEIEPVVGIESGGVGAALVTCLMVWAYIIVRGILRDAVGVFVLVDPIGLGCFIVLDVILAIAIGRWGAQTVANKYKTFQGY